MARFLPHDRFKTDDRPLQGGTRKYRLEDFRRFPDNDNAVCADSEMFPVVFDVPTGLKTGWDVHAFFNDRAAHAGAWAYVRTGQEHGIFDGRVFFDTNSGREHRVQHLGEAAHNHFRLSTPV